MSRGRTHHAAELPGFIAESFGKRKGLLTYRISNRSCEIVTLDRLAQGCGIGSALVRAAIRAARRAGCSRVWLLTTNDNVRALRFYQRRGFRLTALRSGAIDRARRLKPQIPRLGDYGIEIRDELEFQLLLKP